MRFSRNYSLLILALIFCSCGTRKSTTNGSYKTIEEKYTQLLGVSKENISNKKLYSFIDEWYGVKYKYGGKSKSGVDCSGFATILFKEIFGKNIMGSSASLYHQCTAISKKDLQEGDLVFFRIESKEISHVGIYLQNNKFVHATTKAGVMIDDLNEEYYKKYFEGGGRIKQP
ncbi:MAG: C40 family peptidase [Bacteroidetes bacterium]|nr:C40 family peptidase [Bacteroidota bacterium]